MNAENPGENSAYPASTPPEPLLHEEPSASEGEDLAWTADPGEHLGHDEPPAQAPQYAEGPLPVCEYDSEAEEPCEEPAVERRFSGAAVIIAATMGAVVGALLVAAVSVWAFTALMNRATGQTEQRQAVTIKPSDGADTAVAVAAKAQPSVVNISISQRQVNPFTGVTTLEAVGNGSGVILRPDGFILTNNHVVEGADRITVTIGTKDVVAKVVGVDTVTDLAVIKIDGTDLPAIEVGTSKGLKVGQTVFAIGSPFGLDKTVTEGIISALQRSESAAGRGDITTYSNLIQTDAAINPGNSGGALVDAEGKLIGINTLIQSPSGTVGAAQSAGIGFAIPVDFAVQIANQLMTTGKATHPYMGVSVQPIDSVLAGQLGLTTDTGVLIGLVDPGSPADRAGLKRGDVIESVGGRQVSTVEDLFGAIREHSIGETVTVEVIRSGVPKSLQVVLGSDVSAK
jgi:putative serine protease PepD